MVPTIWTRTSSNTFAPIWAAWSWLIWTYSAPPNLGWARVFCCHDHMDPMWWSTAMISHNPTSTGDVQDQDLDISCQLGSWFSSSPEILTSSNENIEETGSTRGVGCCRTVWFPTCAWNITPNVFLSASQCNTFILGMQKSRLFGWWFGTWNLWLSIQLGIFPFRGSWGSLWWISRIIIPIFFEPIIISTYYQTNNPNIFGLLPHVFP